MTRNFSYFCLFSILAYLVTDTVGKESIIGGDIAGIEQFPYHVSVQTDIHGHGCGGAIIHERFVLTAAHCVVKNNGQFFLTNMFVVAGTNNINHFGPSAVRIEVKKVYVPTEYVPPASTSTGDIAVLLLEKPFIFRRHKNLGKIEVPRKKRVSSVGKTASIAGYGWDWVKIEGKEEHGNNTDGYLRFAEALVLNDGPYCDPTKKILEKQICARVDQDEKTSARGVCIGDSGSPLVYQNTVIGILSVSPWRCTEKKSSATYTRVSHYRKFIFDAINDKQSPDIKSFTLIL